MHVVMDAVPALAAETLPSAWGEHQLAVRQDADGVAHLIDTVLLPFPFEDEAMPEDEMDGMTPDDGMQRPRIPVGGGA